VRSIVCFCYERSWCLRFVKLFLTMVRLIFLPYTLLIQAFSVGSTGVSVKMTMVIVAGTVIVSTLIEIGDTIIVRRETVEVVVFSLVSNPIVKKTNTMITMTAAAIHHAVPALQIPINNQAMKQVLKIPTQLYLMDYLQRLKGFQSHRERVLVPTLNP
jgi:hypothetical protein